MAGSKGPLPIKDVVNKVISDLSGSGDMGRRPSAESMNALWRKAVGKFASRRSRPVSLKQGRLIVNVEDSSLLYNLTLKKREIIESLTKELKDRVQKIQFRIGETREEQKTEAKDKRQKHRRN